MAAGSAFCSFLIFSKFCFTSLISSTSLRNCSCAAFASSISFCNLSRIICASFSACFRASSIIWIFICSSSFSCCSRSLFTASSFAAFALANSFWSCSSLESSFGVDFFSSGFSSWAWGPAEGGSWPKPFGRVLLERVANASFASFSLLAFSFTASGFSLDCLGFGLGFSSCPWGPPPPSGLGSGLGSGLDSGLDSGSGFAATRFFLMKFLVSSAIFVEVSLLDVTRFNTLEIRFSIEVFSSFLVSFSTTLETGSDSGSGTGSGFSDNNFS